MRGLIAFAIASALACFNPNYAVAAGACPADPVKAGLEVWPGGSLTISDEVTATHPCGKKLTCRGGNAHRGIPRHCAWG